jgi:hypothetical protein
MVANGQSQSGLAAFLSQCLQDSILSSASTAQPRQISDRSSSFCSSFWRRETFCSSKAHFCDKRCPSWLSDFSSASACSDVVATDPNYRKWFLKKWGASPKKEHQTFSLFLGLWIERQELEQGKSPGGNASTEPMPPKVVPVCPKAKGKPMTTGGKSSAMEPI